MSGSFQSGGHSHIVVFSVMLTTCNWWEFPQAIETEHFIISLKISCCFTASSVKLIDGVYCILVITLVRCWISMAYMWVCLPADRECLISKDKSEEIKFVYFVAE